jgi:hypothetical protein
VAYIISTCTTLRLLLLGCLSAHLKSFPVLLSSSLKLKDFFFASPACTFALAPCARQTKCGVKVCSRKQDIFRNTYVFEYVYLHMLER